MNHRKIAGAIIGIIALLTLAIPLFDGVAQLMNLPNSLAYLGPVVMFIGGAGLGYGIFLLSQSIYNQVKPNIECQKKATGKSSKKNVKSKNKINN
jgi:hypothetical protein